jgi:hypothetical protein
MQDIVQRLEYSDARTFHFVALSNRSLRFLIEISRIFFSDESVARINSQLKFVTSNYLNFVLDVAPDCALNGGKDRVCA